MSKELPADVRHVLWFVLLGLPVALLTVAWLQRHWPRSYAAVTARAYCHALACRFRRLRKRPPKTAAGTGCSPTPAPAVGHDEVSRGRHQ